LTAQLRVARADKTPITGTDAIISNGIMNASVDASGVYTVDTGPSYPTPNDPVLFPLGTSYNTVEVTDTAQEYAESGYLFAPDPGYSVVYLGSCLPTFSSTATSVTNTWTTPEDLAITQVISVQGSTTANTVVSVTMTITNNNLTSSHTVGVRYEWDLYLDYWDGSWVRPWTTPTTPGAWVGTETSWTPPLFPFYEIANYNGTNVLSPFSVYGSVSMPADSTQPDNLVYAWWSNAVECYSYTPTGLPIGGSGPGVGGYQDSCMLYYWNPTTLAPGGGTMTVTADFTTFVPTPPVSVIAEVPWGTIISSVTMLLALVAFVSYKLYRPNLRLRASAR
jgi:hypothetical protein